MQMQRGFNTPLQRWPYAPPDPTGQGTGGAVGFCGPGGTPKSTEGEPAARGDRLSIAWPAALLAVQADVGRFQCILVPDWVRHRMLRRSAEGATRVTLDEIKALGLRLAELCQKYGIAELSVFGSVARGDAQPDSDVDLLYVRAPGNDLGMSYFALQDDLEKLFGRPVDLVPKEGLHRVIRDQVLADAQVLYAA
jgi:uncharacterized protein